MANKWNLEGVAVDTLNNMTVTGTVTTPGLNGYVIFPTADPLIAGAWWDDSGTLTKSTGS
jgi:hypothetical protein